MTPAEISPGLVVNVSTPDLKLSDFKLIESSDARLGTEPAKRITYTGSKLGVSLQVMNVIAIHNGKGFAVAYSADPEIFASELPDVQKLVESIRWVQR